MQCISNITNPDHIFTIKELIQILKKPESIQEIINYITSVIMNNGLNQNIKELQEMSIDNSIEIIKKLSMIIKYHIYYRIIINIIILK